MTTRIEIEEDVVDELIQALGDMTLANLPVPLSVTGDGTATTLIDTKLSRGSRDANAYDGRAIKFFLWDTDGTAVESIAVVTTGGFNDGSNTLTFAPALGVAPDALQTYIMYPLGVGPERVLRAIQRGLRMGEAPHLEIPSLVDNASFMREPSAGVDNTLIPRKWATVGTPTTYAFTMGRADEVGVFPGGTLNVSTDAADEGIESADVGTQEGEQFLVSVVVAAAGQAVTVSLRDQTNNALIDSAVVLPASAATSAGGFMEARFSATVPSTCLVVRVRITAADTTTFAIKTPVVLQSKAGRLMSVRHGLYREGQIKGWFHLPEGAAAPDGTVNAFIPYSRPWAPMNAVQGIIRHEQNRAVDETSLWEPGGIVEDKVHGLVQSPIMFPIAAQSDPIGFVYMRAFGESTLEEGSATLTETAADREWAVAEALANLKIPGWRKKANARAHIMGYGSDPDLRITPNPPTAV